MSKTVLIVGGVAGGVAAATRIRRLDESARIIIAERGEYISYANCGLPYYIGGVIPQKSSLLVQTPEKMKAWYNIDVRVGHEVMEIEPLKKTVVIRNLQSEEEYEERYDALLLSPGANPVNISPLGPEAGVFTLRTVQDAERIHNAVGGMGWRAVVIGGGFVGIEVAENLQKRGMAVTLLEKYDILQPFDREMSNYLRLHMKKKKVRVITGFGVDRIEHENGKKEVILENGERIPADMVVVSVGIRPETALARRAGLMTDEGGRIVVDEHMQTSAPGIYAVGDAVQVLHYVSGQHVPVALAGPAAKLARVAADNICGKDVSYNGVLGSNVIKVFNLTGAATGLNERQLKNLSYKFEKCYVQGNNHAKYYPGASPLTLKVLFHPESGIIYGAQAVGTEGTEKRVDVIAAAIKAGQTVTWLQSVDLCYAPPFGSAKDPVNIAGYVAENMMNGLIQTFCAEDVQGIDPESGVLLDIRSREENALQAIPGSVNIPLEELRERLQEVPMDKTIYLYCRGGHKGYVAARFLQQCGYRVKNLNGGYRVVQAMFPREEDEGDIFWD